jgi:murein DD-endopeptidase MepM/ murein hydrolase activator NlpD
MDRFMRLIIVGMAFILVMNFYSCQSKKEQKTESIQIDSLVVIKEPQLKYGFPVDSFAIETGVVKNNQYLSQILNPKGIGMGAIDTIARKSKSIFDVRKIKSGQNFTFFSTPDSINKARYFVYENSATEYTVFELFDSLNIYQGEKEIQTRLRTVHGVIESSMWRDMEKLGQNPLLSNKISKIFAWTIDFFGIQKGDRYRIIYDEQIVDSVSIGIGKIYAVQFDHYKNENYAFYFDEGEKWDYFDENGQSLRKEFLKAPLEFSRVSSRFSHGRMHPVLRIRRPHHGVDYAAPRGTPVVSIGEGTVIARAYQKGGGGNYIKIKHNTTYTTTYMHLSGFAKGIHVGKRVDQGDEIGYVGSTGLSTGPHLDFRVHMYGKPVDPLKIKSDPVEPVKEENLERYNVLKDSLLLELKKIEWIGNLAVSE